MPGDRSRPVTAAARPAIRQALSHSANRALGERPVSALLMKIPSVRCRGRDCQAASHAAASRPQNKSPAIRSEALTGAASGGWGLGQRLSVTSNHSDTGYLVSEKLAECEAFPPSLGARPALRRLPRSPPVCDEQSFRKMAKARPRKKYWRAKIACAMTRQHKSFFRCLSVST